MKMYWTVFIIMLALGLSSQVYACCGGMTVTQYENVSKSSDWYKNAKSASEKYLEMKMVDQSEQVKTQNLTSTFDPNNTAAAAWVGNTGYQWNGILQNQSVVNYLAINFMFDNDANKGGEIAYSELVNPSLSYGNHAVCSISSECHLHYNTVSGEFDPTTVATKALSCPHHTCHWNSTILPSITKYTTKKEGS